MNKEVKTLLFSILRLRISSRSSERLKGLTWTVLSGESALRGGSGLPDIVLPAARAAVLNDVYFSNAYQIILLNRRTLLSDTSNGPTPHPIGRRKLKPIRPHRFDGISTALRSRWNNHYHTLIDLLPRLEQLRHPSMRRWDLINLLAPGGLKPNERYFLDLLELPENVVIRDLPGDGLMRIPEYLLLSFVTAQGCGWVPQPYIERIRSRVCPARPRRQRHRILISRQTARKRRIANFGELQKALVPLGFVAVELETLSLPDQIELFYDAEAVVGSHGAGLTNLLFSDSARVVEIFPNPLPLHHYQWLCRCIGHAYRRLDVGAGRPNQHLQQPDGTVSLDLLDTFTEQRDTHAAVDPARVVKLLSELGIS